MALGGGAGAVFGLVLLAFLALTGVLSASMGSIPARQILVESMTRACEQLVPWLVLWVFVLPALLRLPFGQPWLALLVYVAFAVFFVPIALDLTAVSSTERFALGLFALVTALPVIRAFDVWLSSGFVVALHLVTVSVAGLPFGTTAGYGLFDAQATGDALVTGGRLGPVFGLFGMLGLCWIAGSMLQHQRRLFADAPFARWSRRDAMADFGVGFVIAAAAASLMFVAMVLSGQIRIAAAMPSLAAISASLATALPRALAAELLLSYGITALLLRITRRPGTAIVSTVAVAIAWHLQTPGTTSFTAAGVAVTAAASAAAFVCTGRLWMSVALRYGWWLCVGTIYGFPLDGWPVRLSWFRQDVVQYTAWSGGVHGPDASVIGTLAKLAMLAAVWYAAHPRGERSDA